MARQSIIVRNLAISFSRTSLQTCSTLGVKNAESKRGESTTFWSEVSQA